MVLLVLPWTRGQTLLDWRGATLEQFSGAHPAWAPLDAPYRPEKNSFTYMAPGSSQGRQPDLPALVNANGLSVAPQFASVARSSTDRDVLVWCALSASDSKVVAKNFAALESRFPNDASLLAWTCGAQLMNLSMTTRVPGPLSSPYSFWSVQTTKTPGYHFEIDTKARPKWDTVVAAARRGEKLEPRNGFWWWLEATALIGARRDEEVWPVLRAGSFKTEMDDHSQERLVALRRAHLQVLEEVPSVFFLSNNADSFMFYSHWREATRQVCENVMGARLAGRDKTAIEGGRDIVMMGRLLRRSKDDISVLVGIAVEAIALQNAIPPSISTIKRLAIGANASAFAGHPRSLLRYANELNRKDIALQLTNEWNAVAKARKAQITKTSAALASGSSQVQGVSDLTVVLARGSQNTGALLVQTLPVPLLCIAVLSVLLQFVRRRDEVALPVWTRGLGWSAFALLVLLGAQVLLSHVVWQFLVTGMGWKGFWGYDFTLPRLVTLLPLWVFAFAACVAGVGAVWATIFTARRAQGETTLLARLRGMLHSVDERTGTLNLGPILQLIALAGIWGAFLIGLGAWFYFPQDGALENQASDTLHDQYAGVALALCCFLGTVPAVFFRVRGWGVRTSFVGWLHVARRFLVAHLVLATALYLLLAISGAFWSARFDAEWLKVNAPQAVSPKP